MTARVALALVADPPLLEPETPLGPATALDADLCPVRGRGGLVADPEAAPAPPDAARRVHNLGPAARVPAGEGRTFWVEGREVAVFRDRRRQVFAAQAWCPHHFGSLGDGAVGYGEVTCPLHGLRFDLRSGAPRGHDCGGLRTYPIRVSRDGELLLTIG